MTKSKALEKINNIIGDIEKLEFSKYLDVNPELEKFILKGKRYLKECFGENNSYLKEFTPLEYLYPNAWIHYDDEEKIFQKNNEYYKNDLSKAKSIFEAAIEEINERDNTPEENYLNKIDYFLRSIHILELENNFKRFGVNEYFEKFKLGLEYFLKTSFGENSDELNKFKKIRFLYSGPRGYEGVQVPLDIETYKDGLKSTKILLEVIKENIRINGLTKYKPTATQIISETKKTISNKVFIVHGHDNGVKQEVARFLEKLGLEPIILHEQASSQKTIIEKIESYAGQVGFGVVLYTACDIGGKDENNLQSRARQNVVFEHGYLIGLLGRDKVCPLVKGNIETPGDISGVVYTSMDEAGSWHLPLAKELKAAGYDIDPSKLF